MIKNPLISLVCILALFSCTSSATAPDVKCTDIRCSVVLILDSSLQQGGTGWVTTTSTGRSVVVTNKHVCNINEGGTLLIKDDINRIVTRKVIRSVHASDLCVIEGIDVKPLKIEHRLPAAGAALSSIQHPFLGTAQFFTGFYVGDTISAAGEEVAPNESCKNGDRLASYKGMRVCVQTMHLSQSTIKAYPGSSGSPVFNSNGAVVGVIGSIDDNNNAAFIPLPYVKQILAD